MKSIYLKNDVLTQSNYSAITSPNCFQAMGSRYPKKYIHFGSDIYYL